MALDSAHTKHLLWLILALAVLVLIGIGIFPGRVDRDQTAPVEARPPAMSAPPRDSSTPQRSEPAPEVGVGIGIGVEPGAEEQIREDPFASFPFLDRDQESAFRWAQVDLDEVRAAMPDNAFWERGAPTSDPAVLHEREQERARSNDAWGQVLSGNAGEDEIHDYYAERHRISSDYVEFASHLLSHYGNVLPERDVGLLEFSVQMHQARLQQMPRRLMEALERKEEQDRLREAWLADEAAFEQALLDAAERDDVSPDAP